MRVMRILTRPNLGGPTRQAAALYHAQQALGVRTLLVVGRCEAGEAALDLQALAVPQLDLEAALRGGAAAQGWVAVEDLGRGLHPRADRTARAVLRRLMVSFQPEVVHTHTSKAGWLGRGVARQLGVGVVAHTFHGHVLRDYFDPVRSWLLARLEQWRARQSDLLLAVSASCARELEELGVAAPGRIEVLPPAVAVTVPAAGARAAARQALGLGDDFTAVCAGRLVPIKRIDHFAAAVARTDWLHGDVFGDGPQGDGLRARAPARLRCHGATPDLPRLLPAYDALVLSSVREGYPLVAIEAFAAGVPVVGYDVPGVADALADGRGLLVPASSGPAGLAQALGQLRQDRELAGRCVAAGLAALPQFEPTRVGARLLAAYRSAGKP